MSAILVLLVGASAAQAGTRASARATVRSVEALVDSVRVDHGCKPLRTHIGLARVATQQSRLLLAEGVLDHDAGTPFAERVPRAAPAAHTFGETLAWGTGSSGQAGAIVRSWLESPGHRGVLLDCRYTDIGVGVATGTFGGYENATVYTADLAA